MQAVERLGLGFDALAVKQRPTIMPIASLTKGGFF
jgi:hypothetical protein